MILRNIITHAKGFISLEVDWIIERLKRLGGLETEEEEEGEGRKALHFSYTVCLVRLRVGGLGVVGNAVGRGFQTRFIII